jgi:hypothetical protein
MMMLVLSQVMYRSVWLRLTGAVCVVIVAATVPGSAEPANPASDAASVGAKPSPSGHVLSAGKRSKAAQRGATRNAPKDKPWSIKDALPNNSSAVSVRDTDKKDKPEFGKIPLQSGTLSLETDPKIKPLEYPDGQHAPGADSTPHMPPSYLGFSFSVPTK